MFKCVTEDCFVNFFLILTIIWNMIKKDFLSQEQNMIASS